MRSARFLAVSLAALAACSEPAPVQTPVDAGPPVVVKKPGKLQSSATELAFHSLAVGTSATLDITFSNLGESDLSLDPAHLRIVQAAERPFYTITPPEAPTLKANEAKVWKITYAPLFGGVDPASLQVDWEGQTTSVALNGEGIASDSTVVLRSARVTLGTSSMTGANGLKLSGSVGLGIEAVEMKNDKVKVRLGGR